MATVVCSALTPPKTPLHSRLSLSWKIRAASAAIAADLRVVFTGGGTGGHIYPAVAIADELKQLNPHTRFLFIGTPTGVESSAVPSAGYPFAAVEAAPLARPLFSLKNLFVLPWIIASSTFRCYKILQKFDPHVVIGTGGFVSFPTCLAAAIKGAKLVIQEQNSVPGIANLALSLLAHKIFVAFNSTVEWFWQRSKCVVCGNPVRVSLVKCSSKADARTHFFPNVEVKGKGKLVLVLGGSLGANPINISLLNLHYQILNENDDLFIIWQTGVKAFHEMESLVKNHPRLLLSPFLHEMDSAYAAADLVVSRSGAMTCSEILATGKPCILIPSPYVAEGHQFKNASLMADLAGSRVIMEDELSSATLRKAIQEVLDDETLMAEMSEKALRAAKMNASADIAQHILARVNCKLELSY